MQSVQTKEYGGKMTRFIDITLEDLENNRISCTLWEDYVDAILPYLESHTFDPLVVIIQMCQAKVFRDEVKVSNTFHVTKLIVNGDIEEIENFRTRIVNSNKPEHSISHVSFPAYMTIAEDLASGQSPFRMIDQLFENEEVGSFWVSATIFSIIGDWWYLSCKRCPRKITRTGDKFHCEHCDKFSQTGNFRYRMQFEVGDDSANAQLLCWDRDCETLIGKSCSELKNELIEKEGWEDLPDELASLVDRKALFKVQVKANQVKHFTGAFSVMRWTTYVNLLKKYASFFIQSQESDFLSKLQGEEDMGDKSSSSEDEVSTPNKPKEEKEPVGESSSLKRPLFEESTSKAWKLKKDIKVEDEENK